jgi:hypothetical protein
MLGIRSPDPMLSMVAAIGLGASVGTALIVDMTVAIASGGRRTLRDIVADGPSVSELSPGRSGLALISGGGVDPDIASEVIDRLASRWPAVVIRVDAPGWRFPIVPVTPLYPGRLVPAPAPLPGVWQPLVSGQKPPGPGPVLPRLRPGVLRRLLNGSLPRRSGWIEAWRPVWEMPWA